MPVDPNLGGDPKVVDQPRLHRQVSHDLLGTAVHGRGIHDPSAQHDMHKIRLDVIEDALIALTVVTAIFSSLGLECHKAETGQIALELLKKNKLIKDTCDGYTADKTMRLKCRIPLVEFAKIGHIIAPGGVVNEKELDKWLDSQEGEKCKTVKGSARHV